MTTCTEIRFTSVYSPECVERLSGKSVGGASTRLDRSLTTRKYDLFTPLRGPCSPGSVPVGTFQTVSGRGILRSSFAGSCIECPPRGERMPSEATHAAWEGSTYCGAA